MGPDIVFWIGRLLAFPPSFLSLQWDSVTFRQNWVDNPFWDVLPLVWD